MTKKLTNIVSTKKLADIPAPDYYVPDEPIHFKGSNTKIVSVKEGYIDPYEQYNRDRKNSTHNKWMQTNDNHHLGENVSDISHKLREAPHNIDIDDTHHHYIQKYTGDSSDLNRHLIHSHNDKLPPSEHHNWIHNMDEVTKHPIGHHLSLYSGVNFNPHHLKKKHGHMFLPAYTSLTHDKDIASSFAYNKDGIHNILHIRLRPHDKARHISGHSTIAGEHETILPRRTLLHVHHIPQETTEPLFGKNGHRRFNIWHARVIKQG